MLAYVFWHRPAVGRADAAYGRLAGALHAALAEDPPEGFVGSASYLVEDVPWLGAGGPGVEDWYLVQGWSALGALEEAALDAGRRLPHDAAAAASGAGAGAVYGLVAGEPVSSGRARWADDAPGAPPEGGALWRRRLVLGPAPQWVGLDGVRGAVPGREPVG